MNLDDLKNLYYPNKSRLFCADRWDNWTELADDGLVEVKQHASCPACGEGMGVFGDREDFKPAECDMCHQENPNFMREVNLSEVSWSAYAYVTDKGVKAMSTEVESPSHYNVGKYEVIDVIEDWGLGFNLGNAVKYIARCKHKHDDPSVDLEKAIYYLNRELGK